MKDIRHVSLIKHQRALWLQIGTWTFQDSPCSCLSNMIIKCESQSLGAIFTLQDILPKKGEVIVKRDVL